jgi:uncharacterized protein GlcG (DUF336 family)
MDEISMIFRNITLAGAKQVRDTALQKAAELRVSVSVVVVDRAGVLLLAETQDGAAPGAPEASLMKAKGAARYRVATHLTAEFVKAMPPGLAAHALSLPEACAFQGGVPLKMAGEVIGGVGISGGKGEQDVEIATAAADVFL